MREYKSITVSFEKYRSRILIMGLFVFLFHGAKLGSNIIGIDTEDIIKLQGDFYGGWLTTGRQGLVLLKGLLGSLWFNPYFAGLLTLLFLTAAAVSFFLLWDWMAGGERSSCLAGFCLGAFLWISHPIMTEQLYFSLQSAEICMGIFLTAAALFFTEKWIQSRRSSFFLTGVLLLLLTFSLYQVFVVFYIFGTVTVLLLQGMLRGEAKVRDIIRRQAVPYTAIFMTAFFVNTVLTRLFFGSSDYLQEQIVWGSKGFFGGMRAILGHMAKVCTGYGSLYYTGGYGALCILTVLLFAAVLRRKKYTGGVKALLSFFLLALFFTPFLMTIVCGGAPVFRSQLILPVMTGFLAYFDVCLWKALREASTNVTVARRVAAVCIGAVCIVTGTLQLQTTLRLYYTDSMRYEQDAAFGRELITRLEQVMGDEELPVIVLGRKKFEGNAACVRGEVIGRSFFDYDTEVEPEFFWSTRRMLGFLSILGKDYAMVAEDRVPEAMEYSLYMPEWPAEKSVQVHEGMIVVKLGHYEE